MQELQDRLRSGHGPGLRVVELALVCGCSPRFIQKLIKADALKVGRVGRVIRIPVRAAAELAREAGAI